MSIPGPLQHLGSLTRALQCKSSRGPVLTGQANWLAHAAPGCLNCCRHTDTTQTAHVMISLSAAAKSATVPGGAWPGSLPCRRSWLL